MAIRITAQEGAGPDGPTSGEERSAVLSLLACSRGLLSRAAVWYAIFAVYSGAVAAFSGPGLDEWWGIWAVAGYTAAAVLAACWPGARGALAALAAAVAGAVVASVIWLVIQEPGTSDGTVVTRSASLLVHHGTPYLPSAALAYGGWLAYNPYLPVMSLFGLPKAAGLPGLAGDTRLWLVAVTFAALLLAFRVVAPGRPSSLSLSGAAPLAAFATASPLLAFPLALSITDPPITALVVLALALLTRPAGAGGPAAGRRSLAAAVVLGVACAMKYTAWPALAVLIAMTAARDGARSAVRLAATSVVTALILAAALAPAARTAPAALIDNTIAYPLGLTSARSPAQSPLPGHILATLGPGGHAAAIALLIVAGLAVAASLFIRPPADPRAATYRLALALILLFVLSPATRFGYLAYPLALYGWLALTRPAGSAVRRHALRPGNGPALSAG
jgi:Glycosyltransferase family 87